MIQENIIGKCFIAIPKIKSGWMLLLLLAFSFSGIAQDDEVPPTRNRDFDIDFPHRHHRGIVTTYFGGMDIGINGYTSKEGLNLPNDLDNFELDYGRSWEVTVHLVKQRIDLYKNRIRLYYGPEINFKYYRFTNDVTLVPGGDELIVIRDEIDYKKNRLRTTMLTFPVLLDFKTKTSRQGHSFRFAAGGYGSLLLSAGQKQKSDEFGKRSVRDDFNLNKLRYGLIAKVGLGPVGFYGKYDFAGLFKSGEGPELHPFTIGISLFHL